jgi:hypothetical protein
VYRQLHKGREDAKNEPGAADFYYGECEMRRHALDTPWAEKAILTATGSFLATASEPSGPC